MGFARFMASTAGRLIRIVAGAALIVVGVFVMGNVLGFVLAVVGLVPLLAGLMNVCVFAPLFGGPFMAKNIS
jgi:hypothetical protein